MTLFDDFTRVDAAPARNQEGSFAFLNRVATPWWSEVRRLLERWFQEYCLDASPEKAVDLRARFRSPDGRQHLGAWWELYVYRLLRALYPDKSVKVEPERPGQTGRPDFCVATDAGGSPELWVEAVTTFSGITESGRHGAREAYVLDTINELKSPDFRLMITFRAVGAAHPKKREILEPLRSWLNTLDREDLVSRIQEGERRRPQTILRPDGWEVLLEAIPKGKPGIHPNDRLIGIGPISVGFVDDVPQARKSIAGKTGRYRGLEAPLLVAVMPVSPTFDAEDAVAVLYGSEAVRFDPEHLDEPGRLIRTGDGVWSNGDDRVSAVMFGPRVFPWTVATVWPQLWLNPHAAQRLGAELSLLPRVAVGEDERLESSDPDDLPARVLGLDANWPGSGDPWDVGAGAGV